MAVHAASLWLAAFPRCGAGLIVLPSSESAMREPLSWPYDTELTWRAWREHLETLQVPHVDELRLEAERELQRIARCRADQPRPRSKPALVPVLNEHPRGPAPAAEG